ncbi:Deazaflavin-dependent nitroreductase [Pseudomonas sp. IT-196MI5]
MKTCSPPKNPGVFHGTQPRLWVIAKSSREVKQFVITQTPKNPHNAYANVGASLLAMEANDDAGYLTPRGVLRFFASKLAPTVALRTMRPLRRRIDLDGTDQTRPRGRG